MNPLIIYLNSHFYFASNMQSLNLKIFQHFARLVSYFLCCSLSGLVLMGLLCCASEDNILLIYMLSPRTVLTSCSVPLLISLLVLCCSFFIPCYHPGRSSRGKENYHVLRVYHLEPRVSVHMSVLVRKQYDRIFSKEKFVN